MIIERLEQLPDLSAEDLLCVDIESTSFNDAEKGYHPFNGHRICGVGVGTPDGRTWYLPLRHAPLREAGNLPLEGALAWLKDLGRRERTWVGHNIKFDARFFYVDGVELSGVLQDTVCLARLVNALRFSAQLEVLSKEYLPPDECKDATRVKQELTARKTQDYGRIPVDILGEA